MKSYRFFRFSGLVLIALFWSGCEQSKLLQTEVLVIGGGTAGTAAAVSSARMGVSTVLINAHPWLGGMLTSAGVSAVDGNTKLPSGFWGEFRDSLIQRYGSAAALKTGWVSNAMFEPAVGAAIFKNIAANETQLNVFNNSQWGKISRHPQGWEVKVETPKGSLTVVTKQLIDATELGDVAAAVGVVYSVGMDSTSTYNEDIAPAKSNTIIQDLTYVVTLEEKDAPVQTTAPSGYNPSVFYCATKSEKCNQAATMQRVLWPAEKMITYGALPNNKFMINWPINGNDYYVNAISMSPKKRQQAFEEAKLKTKQFVYYLQTELGFTHLGIASEEYPTEDGFPLMPYHRESRRIQGLVTLTLNHIAAPYAQNQPLYRAGIAVGDYPVDHHHDAKPQSIAAPELYFYPVPSYTVPLGVLLPKEIPNLLVTEKSISVSNIVNGTTRLQPVVLQLGQAAGITAALAVQQQQLPKAVLPRQVQQKLLDQGGYLLPFLDVPKTHPHFKSYQRIGVTGILRGTGKNVGWENQTWLYPKAPLEQEALYLEGWEAYFPSNFPAHTTVQEIVDWCTTGFKAARLPEWMNSLEAIKAHLNFAEFEATAPITRGQFAVLVDALFDPFSRPIDQQGFWLENKMEQNKKPTLK